MPMPNRITRLDGDTVQEIAELWVECVAMVTEKYDLPEPDSVQALVAVLGMLTNTELFKNNDITCERLSRILKVNSIIAGGLLK